LSLPDAGTFYDGIDIAIKERNSDCIYLLSKGEGNYTLWHSDDGGANWEGYNGDPGPFRHFGSEPVSKVIVTEYNGYDCLWVISPTQFHIYAGWLPPEDRWIDNDIAHAPAQCAAFDPTSISANWPCGELYLGTKYSIQKLLYQSEVGGFSLHSEGKEKGSNIFDVASLDYIDNDYGFVKMCVLSKSGGYISNYYRAPEVSGDWFNLGNLQQYAGNPDADEVIGKKVAYYHNRQPDIDRQIDYSAALGSNSSGEQFILSRYGIEIYNGSNHFKTIIGPYYNTSSSAGPYLAGNTSVPAGQSWDFSGGTLSNWNDFGSNFETINDMQLGRTPSPVPETYACGSRDNPSRNLAAYSNNYNNTLILDDGLASTNNAYSILPSREKGEVPNIFYQSLYLGSDNGIYKNDFDRLSSTEWRRVLDTGPNLDVIDLADFNRLVSQPPTYDSIVHYALAKDRTTGDPYVYVTPDSGRSWLEIGESLRNQALRVNEITMLYDPFADPDHPCFLAAGTNRGVHKIAYNVKSGVLEQDETWGPGLVVVNGDVTVPEGITLTIAAGTKVLMTYQFDRLGAVDDRIEVTVMGNLILDGQPGDSVIITSSSPEPEPDDWFGIVVYPGGQLSMSVSRLDYTRYAITASEQSKIAITNSVISNCKEMGLFQKDVPEAALDIRETHFKNCGTYAMQICGGPAILRNDTISGMVAYGISYVGHDDVEITGCEVTTIDEKSYWGVYIKSDNTSERPSLLLTEDYVSGFTQGGYYLESCDGHGPDIKNVWAYNSGVYGIYLADSPVSLRGDSEESRNSFCNDYYGIYCAKQSSGVFRWNNVKENRYCVFIDDSSNPDFGTRDNPGKNSFRRADNIYNSYEMYSESRSTISANFNYWGSENPRLYGEIDDDNRLETDPMPYLPKNSPVIPVISALSIANYPNPFNANTEIRFSLAQTGDISLKVFDIAGRLVKELANGNYDTGEHSVIWEGTNSNGKKVSSGIYFYSISAPEKAITKKMVFLK
jgi:hypothetical protein